MLTTAVVRTCVQRAARVSFGHAGPLERRKQRAAPDILTLRGAVAVPTQTQPFFCTCLELARASE
jgi:hypothetical protein